MGRAITFTAYALALGSRPEVLGRGTDNLPSWPTGISSCSNSFNELARSRMLIWKMQQRSTSISPSSNCSIALGMTENGRSSELSRGRT